MLFTQEWFDLICSNLSVLPISRAVAASNGFPGLFSPVTLTNRAKECGGRTPGWLRRITPAERNDALSRSGVEAVRAERYLDASRTRYLHLSDGGVSDNLAMRAAGGMMQTFTSTDLQARGFVGVRRILLLSIDGEGGQDNSIANRKEVAGIFSLLGLVSGGQIDSYNFETPNTVSQQMQQLARVLRDARCSQSPVIDGKRCDDVDVEMIHISLAGLPPSPQQAQLLAIPTGLTLARSDVDLLVRAGHDAVVNSAPLRGFLSSYPPAPLRTLATPRPQQFQGAARVTAHQ